MSERRIRMNFTEKIIIGLEKKVENLKADKIDLLDKIDDVNT